MNYSDKYNDQFIGGLLFSLLEIKDEFVTGPFDLPVASRA